jgi:hypothetical protein
VLGEGTEPDTRGRVRSPVISENVVNPFDFASAFAQLRRGEQARLSTMSILRVPNDHFKLANYTLYSLTVWCAWK